MHTWGLTVLCRGGCLVAKAVASEGPRPVRIASRLLARIGMYSYSIYLWHLFFRHFLRRFYHTPDLSRLVCYLAGGILFGIAAAKLIEIPVLRFRDRVFPASSYGVAPPSPVTLAAGAPDSFSPAPLQHRLVNGLNLPGHVQHGSRSCNSPLEFRQQMGFVDEPFQRARAQAAADECSTNRPFASCRISSGIPPRFDPITGVPAASAS